MPSTGGFSTLSGSLPMSGSPRSFTSERPARSLPNALGPLWLISSRACEISMFYEIGREKDSGFAHDPFKALVAPRPIGWITAMSAKGEINLSPYSFFNAVSSRPNMVAFSSDGRKDAVTFIEETREFVCNLASYDLREPMNATSAPLPRGDNEMVHAGLTAAPSHLVKPPRVAEAPAALECKWLQTVPLTPLGEAEPVYYMIIGQVIG